MSLKFGIYLVEQRIITPEQFCGLVKVQQEATMSIATISLRKNVLTINQLAKIFDLQEESPEKSFVQIATENDFMDVADANQLLRTQELSCPSIEKLVVECGLLTQRQAAVLNHHFMRLPATSTTTEETGTTTQDQAAIQENETVVHGRPRKPKFQQRPVVAHPYVNPGY